jgi:predicted Fe-Mo cluster-binding NifX family protein
MKIIVSTDNGHVSAHFGRCAEFTLVEIDGDKIINKESIPNPGHAPGFLPQYFDEMGVKAVIAGGAGRRARTLFAEKDIQLILGATGDVDSVLHLLCKGELEGGESLCIHEDGGGHGDGTRGCGKHENH